MTKRYCGSCDREVSRRRNFCFVCRPPTTVVTDSWGRYGKDAPCKHLIELRELLQKLQLCVWSEHGVSPDGWVNVHCEVCAKTYETTLRPQEGQYDQETVTWSNEDINVDET